MSDNGIKIDLYSEVSLDPAFFPVSFQLGFSNSTSGATTGITVGAGLTVKSIFKLTKIMNVKLPKPIERFLQKVPEFSVNPSVTVTNAETSISIGVSGGIQDKRPSGMLFDFDAAVVYTYEFDSTTKAIDFGDGPFNDLTEVAASGVLDIAGLIRQISGSSAPDLVSSNHSLGAVFTATALPEQYSIRINSLQVGFSVDIEGNTNIQIGIGLKNSGLIVGNQNYLNISAPVEYIYDAIRSAVIVAGETPGGADTVRDVADAAKVASEMVIAGMEKLNLDQTALGETSEDFLNKLSTTLDAAVQSAEMNPPPNSDGQTIYEVDTENGGKVTVKISMKDGKAIVEEVYTDAQGDDATRTIEADKDGTTVTEQTTDETSKTTVKQLGDNGVGAIIGYQQEYRNNTGDYKYIEGVDANFHDDVYEEIVVTASRIEESSFGDLLSPTAVDFAAYLETGDTGVAQKVMGAGEVGASLGSTLGSYFAGDDVTKRLALQTLSASVGQVLGETVGNVLFADFSVGAALDDAISRFDSDLANNALGAVSSLLAGELISAIGIDGLPAEILETAAGTIISTIATNLATNNASALDGLDVNLANVFGTFLGSKLANEIVSFDSIGGQLGMSLGAGAGGAIAASFFLSESSKLLGQILVPGAGAFLGAIVGGLIGSLLGGTPRSAADLAWSEGQGGFVVSDSWARKGGNREAAQQLAQSVADSLNGIIELVGGTVINGEEAQGGTYGLRKDYYTYRNEPSEAQGKSDIDVTFKGETGLAKLMGYGVYKALDDIEITGGDVYIKRALYRSLELEQVSDTQKLDSLIGNLSTGQDYGFYLENKETLNSFYTVAYDSALMSSWTATLARAKELGLNKRHEADWFGGWSKFLETNGVPASLVNFDGFVPGEFDQNGAPITWGAGSQAHFDEANIDLSKGHNRAISLSLPGLYLPIEGANVLASDKDLIEGTSGNDVITLTHRSNGEYKGANEVDLSNWPDGSRLKFQQGSTSEALTVRQDIFLKAGVSYLLQTNNDTSAGGYRFRVKFYDANNTLVATTAHYGSRLNAQSFTFSRDVAYIVLEDTSASGGGSTVELISLSENGGDGRNLLQNGDFKNGLSGWIPSTSSSGGNVSIDTSDLSGEAGLEFIQGTTPAVMWAKQNVTLTAGKSYTIIADIEGAAAGETLQFQFFTSDGTLHTQTGTQGNGVHTVTINPTWDISYVQVTAESKDGGRIILNDISLKENGTGPELLRNSDFMNGLGNWTYNNGGKGGFVSVNATDSFIGLPGGWAYQSGGETTWATVAGPDGSNVIAMAAAQSSDLNNFSGGGIIHSNDIDVDTSKTYEVTIYFKPTDLDKQTLIVGGAGQASDSTAWLEQAWTVNDDGTSGDWKSTNFTNLDADRRESLGMNSDTWYKLVAYILPDDSAQTSQSDLGGIYDTTTGEKVDVVNTLRWNEAFDGNDFQIRAYTYGDQTVEGTSMYLYEPQVREIGESEVVGGVDRIENTAGLTINGVESTGRHYDVDVAAEVHGGDGDDTINGGDLGNDLFGDAGNDIITGGLLDDWIYGGEGNDTLYAAASILDISNGDYLDGGSGDDTLNGSAGSEWLEGGDGFDKLYGGQGDDVLSGGANGTNQQDILRGGVGNDTYIWRLGDGNETLDEAHFNAAGNVNDSFQNFNLTDWLNERQSSSWFAREQVYANAVGVGTSGTYLTTTGEVGNGEDTLALGAGITLNDIVLKKENQNSPDLLVEILDSNGDVQNTITLKDWFNPMHRIEKLQFADGTTINIEHLQNFIIGDDNDNVLIGTNVGDFIYGADGDDEIYALGGNDWANGGGDNDYVSGGDDDDVVLGAKGNDSLLGGKGEDTVLGGQGRDLVLGGLGNDTLAGDEGADIIIGGGGDDVFQFSRGDGHDLMIDNVAPSSDTIIRQNGSFTSAVTVEYVTNSKIISTIKKGSEVIYRQGSGWIGNTYYDDSTDTLHYIDLNGSGVAAPDPMANDEKVLELQDFLDAHRYIRGLVGTGVGEDDSTNDRLEFGVGIEAEDLHFYKDEETGQDLIIGISDAWSDSSILADMTDSITIKDWYGTAGETIDNFVLFNTGQINMEDWTLVAGSDDDDSASAGGTSISGSTGKDWITANAGDDTVDGGSGNDIIYGGSGGDVLKGGAGNDTIIGGSGADIIQGGAGADDMYGGAGEDTLDYSESEEGISVGVRISMTNGTVRGPRGSDSIGDTFSGFENITGSEGADQIFGDTQNNVIEGNGGNDWLEGSGGDDTYVYNWGDGNDTIGIFQRQVLDDVIIDENRQAAPGVTLEVTNFTGTWDRSTNTWREGKADVTVRSSINNTIVYQGTVDTDETGQPALGSLGAYLPTWPSEGRKNGLGEKLGYWARDHNIGNAADVGEDTILFGEGITTNDIVSITGDDTSSYLKLNLSDGAYIQIWGGYLNGNITPSYLPKWLEFADGSKIDFQALVTDGVTSDGDETIFKNDGGTLDMQGGNDTVISRGTANLSINLGDGDDAVFAGGGNETIEGGAGEDTVYYTMATDNLNVDLNAGTGSGQAAGDTYSGIEHVWGNDAVNMLTGDYNNNKLFGLGGNDRLYGNGGDDYLEGGEGNDELQGNAGNDILMGGDGEDTIAAGNGNDIIYAGDGDDKVVWGHAGNDTIYGEAGNDTLNGTQNNDTLVGGIGDDTLWGDWGSISLSEAEAEKYNDMFVFSRNDGHDTIKDYNGVQDSFVGQITASGLDDDVIAFDADINFQNLWFQKLDADLKIYVLNGDTTVLVENYFVDISQNLNLSVMAGDSYNNNPVLSRSQVDILIEKMTGDVPTDVEDITGHANYADIAAVYGVEVAAAGTQSPEAPGWDIISFPEGEAGRKVAFTQATDPQNQALTYTIVGGTGADFFTIDGHSLKLKQAFDFESPAFKDSWGLDRSTTVKLQAEDTDGNVSETWTVTVNAQDVNEAPVITEASGGNGTEDGDQIGYVTATDPDGDTLTYSINEVSNTGGQNFYRIDSQTGEIYATLVPQSQDPYKATVTVTVTDGEISRTSTNIDISVTGTSEGGKVALPVVLDLDGDGVELVSVNGSTVHVDMDGDGATEVTGWVGADDGLLALDRNGDGLIGGISEFSFVDDVAGASSDLEGLLAYDSNDDGMLSAADTHYGDFLIWQDANQNGVSEAGELKTLSEMGILSINLGRELTGQTTDGATDNVITAYASYLNADGTSGQVGDVAFVYLDNEDDHKEVIETTPVTEGDLTPVILDIDGDGVSLTEEGNPEILFDVDGDGDKDSIGWFGSGDAVLSLDRNSDGVITDGSEISFLEDLAGAKTDLEGLKAFDSNDDGLLTAADEGYDDFLLWQDVNQDGVSQSDELISLKEAGISSISLTSNPTGQTLENTEGNVVFGTGAFSLTDGSAGQLLDTALHYEVTRNHVDGPVTQDPAAEEDTTESAAVSSVQEGAVTPSFNTELWQGRRQMVMEEVGQRHYGWKYWHESKLDDDYIGSHKAWVDAESAKSVAVMASNEKEAIAEHEFVIMPRSKTQQTDEESIDDIKQTAFMTAPQTLGEYMEVDSNTGSLSSFIASTDAAAAPTSSGLSQLVQAMASFNPQSSANTLDTDNGLHPYERKPETMMGVGSSSL